MDQIETDVFKVDDVGYSMVVVDHPDSPFFRDLPVLLIEVYREASEGLVLGFTKEGSVLTVEYHVEPEMREMVEAKKEVWKKTVETFKSFLTTGVQRVCVKECKEADVDEIESELEDLFPELHIYFENIDEE